MDELDEVLEDVQRQLSGAQRELAALRKEHHDKPLATLAQKLADVQADTTNAEKKNGRLSERLEPQRQQVKQLRETLARLRK